MKTTVYFVRHAQSDNTNKDEMTRPLTEKGLQDRMLALEYLKDKQIDAIYSSPYLRAVTTVQPLADHLGLPVVTEPAFRERATGDTAGIEDFARLQWSDKNFAAPGGESFLQVQGRVGKAFMALNAKHRGETYVVGCHGMMLGTVVNYFDKSFEYEQFQQVRGLMPWIVELVFEDGKCISLQSIDPFNV